MKSKSHPLLLPGPRRRAFTLVELPAVSKREARGFTLVELLVVIAILALLIGILLPALNAVRAEAKRVQANAQLESISHACQAYFIDFQAYPGYFSDAQIASDWESFTSSESMLMSLMGGMNNIGSADGRIGVGDVYPDDQGNGPTNAAGRTRDPYYSPKAGELEQATGTVGEGTPNTYKELVDPAGDMPVLYWRAHTSGGVPADQWGNSAVYARSVNDDYVRATDLTATGKNPKDQAAKSVLANGNENNNFAYLVVDPALSTLTNGANGADDRAQGGFALFSAGNDGIYFSRDDIGSDSISDIEDIGEFDDVRAFGGSK